VPEQLWDGAVSELFRYIGAKIDGSFGAFKKWFFDLPKGRKNVMSPAVTALRSIVDYLIRRSLPSTVNDPFQVNSFFLICRILFVL